MMFTRKNAIRKIVNKFSSSVIEEEYQKSSISKSTHNYSIENIIDKSDILEKEIKNTFKALHIDDDFDDISILKLPTPTFVANACAVYYGRYRFIVLSQGFTDLIRLFVVHEILRRVVPRKHKLDLMPNKKQHERIRDLDDLFFKIVASQYLTDRAVPLLPVWIEIPNLFQNEFLLKKANLLAFIILHEISHFKLKHINGFSWFPQQINNRPLLVPEETNKDKNEEHDADVYAMERPEEVLSKQLLFSLGAMPFFSFLSFVETAARINSDSHPYPGNRLQLLYDRFNSELDLCEIASLLASIRDMHIHFESSADAIFHGGKLGSKIREDYKGKIEGHKLAEEISSVGLYYMLGQYYMSDVRKRPDAYNDIAQFNSDS